MEDGGAIVNNSSIEQNCSSRIFCIRPIEGGIVILDALSGQRTRGTTDTRERSFPGPIHSNIGNGVFDKHPEYIKPLADQTALGRIGMPQDVARVIVNLLSDNFECHCARY